MKPKWQKDKQQKGRGKELSSLKAEVASLKELVASKEEDQQVDDTKAYIASIVDEAVKKAGNPSYVGPKTTYNASALRSILKKANLNHWRRLAFT